MSTGQRADPLIGRLVDGRYRVRARIARGGMATVYVATDLRLERRVALKVMHSHLSDDSVFQSRFIQEARAAARLADPHVVNVFDQGQDDDMAYLVMEYLPGITLRELVRDQKRLSVRQTITIMDAVLSGLAAAHRAGIVHRDVKPENVLLAEDGRIKIGDFGLARATTANTASGQMLMGTIAYLAPELVTRGTADARSDIYSLGIMLYEMLTGEQPYKGEQPMQIAYQHATDTVPRPSVRAPGTPEALDELVLWATERDPAARPADADEMLTRLREIEQRLGIAPEVARTLAAAAAVEVSPESEAPTRAYAPDMTGATAALPELDNADRLRVRARRRSARGGWLLAFALIAAALTGASGWWFGSGPGSLVAVPDLRGASFDQAQAALAAQGLTAVRIDEYSVTIPVGAVIGTDPAAGARVEKDSPVSVVVSLGPQPHDLPPMEGRPLPEVTATLQQAGLAVADAVYVFGDADPEIVVGVLVTPRGTDTPVDCTGGCTVHEGDAAQATVSRGPVPDVSGMSIGQATSTLEGVGLVVAENYQEAFSDTVSDGKVVGIAARTGGGAWRAGDAVTLIVSQGPELFPVPNVVGMSRDQAKSALTRAGFVVSYDERWDGFPDPFTTVESQNPKADSNHPKGTEVSLRIKAAL